MKSDEELLKELTEKASKGKAGEFWQTIEEGLRNWLCPFCEIQLKLETAHGYYRLGCPKCRLTFVVVEEYPDRPPSGLDKDMMETLHDMFARRRWG